MLSSLKFFKNVIIERYGNAILTNMPYVCTITELLLLIIVSIFSH